MQMRFFLINWSLDYLSNCFPVTYLIFYFSAICVLWRCFFMLIFLGKIWQSMRIHQHVIWSHGVLIRYRIRNVPDFRLPKSSLGKQKVWKFYQWCQVWYTKHIPYVKKTPATDKFNKNLSSYTMRRHKGFSRRGIPTKCPSIVQSLTVQSRDAVKRISQFQMSTGSILKNRQKTDSISWISKYTFPPPKSKSTAQFHAKCLCIQ